MLQPNLMNGASDDDLPKRSFAWNALCWFISPRCSEPKAARLRRAVQGKHILITGASFGIGEATAYQLAAAGAQVLLVARSKEKLNRVVRQIEATGGRAHAFRADLTDVHDVEGLTAELINEFGHVDIIISNAGKSIRRSIAISYDRLIDFQQTIDINYLGPVQLVLSLLPSMRSRKAGHIVNVSTIGVRLPPAGRWAAYQASKTAFDVWLRSVAHEIQTDKLDVTSVYMPLVHTRMSAPTPMFQGFPMLTAKEAANIIARSLITRRVAVGPWWLPFAQVYSIIFRRLFDRFNRWLFRVTDDSESAKLGTAAFRPRSDDRQVKLRTR